VGLSIWAVGARRPGLLLPAAGFFFSGLVGVVSLCPLLDGWLQTLRAGLGFGLGFLVMSGVLLFTLLPLQGMSGRNPLAPAVVLFVGFTIAFAVAGAIGGLFLGRSPAAPDEVNTADHAPSRFLPSVASFAAGGAVGGTLLAVLGVVVIRVGSLGMGWTRAKVTVVALAMVCFLVSYAVGGALLARGSGQAPDRHR